MTRLISNGVPANSRTGGKNSAIEGPTNPPPESSAATNGVDERSVERIRAVSDIGALRARRSRGGCEATLSTFAGAQ
jgi:hypothetical protein